MAAGCRWLSGVCSLDTSTREVEEDEDSYLFVHLLIPKTGLVVEKFSN
jgi:hypothetical protein